ncbi:hypothetical protein [Paraclostridium bifermentans]|uniref:hypothetical protein n=1 Tax=Paraclostridium bifermentans TaxID=1490 RepID=UPI001C801E4F|nr:hypothetical protein [Paraclostridium bifermentans]GIM33915.1 hypothetical protein PAGU1678_31840 [Paraclostridium bifermentans subsp. muricolitidis]
MPLPTFFGSIVKEKINNINYTFSMNQFINVIEKESKIYNARNNIVNQRNHYEFYKKINAFQTINGVYIKDKVLIYSVFDIDKKGKDRFENGFFKVDLQTFETIFRLGNLFNRIDYKNLKIDANDRKIREKIINSFYSWHLNNDPKKITLSKQRYEPEYVDIWKQGLLEPIK